MFGKHLIHIFDILPLALQIVGNSAPQSRTWIEADRTAVPNFLARIVTFERVASAR